MTLKREEMFEKRIMTSKNKQNIMKHENLLRNTGEGGIIYSTHCAIWQCMLDNYICTYCDNFSIDKKGGMKQEICASIDIYLE